MHNRLINFLLTVQQKIDVWMEKHDLCYICREPADLWCENCEERFCYDCECLAYEDVVVCKNCAPTQAELAQASCSVCNKTILECTCADGYI